MKTKPLGVKVYAKATNLARIEINGEIGWWKNTGEYFTEQVNELLSKGISDVEVYINTPGGSLFDAFEIVNQIKRFSGSKTGILGALCASAGTVIACELDSVKGAKNLNYMIHDVCLDVQIEHESDFESAKQLYVNNTQNAIACYCKKTKLSPDEVAAMMKATTWMNATSAKEKGFIDTISEEEDELTTDAVDVVMTNKYKHVPQMLNQLITNKPEQSMKKIAMKLGLPETATEDEVIAELERRETASLQNTAEGILLLASIGEKNGFKKETITALAKSDFKATVSLVMDATESISATPTTAQATTAPETARMSELLDSLQNLAGKSGGAPIVSMKFSERLEKDKAALKAQLLAKPQEVQKLFEEEYGYLPSVSELTQVV